MIWLGTRIQQLGRSDGTNLWQRDRGTATAKLDCIDEPPSMHPSHLQILRRSECTSIVIVRHFVKDFLMTFISTLSVILGDIFCYHAIISKSTDTLL